MVSDDDVDVEGRFLAAIQQDPIGDEPRLVYADWLEERGDERAEYLRLELQLDKLPRRVNELRARIDPAWLDSVTRTFDLYYLRAESKILAIKLVRTLTGYGLKDAKDLVEQPTPALIQSNISFEEARHALSMASLEGTILEARRGATPIPLEGFGGRNEPWDMRVVYVEQSVPEANRGEAASVIATAAAWPIDDAERLLSGQLSRAILVQALPKSQALTLWRRLQKLGVRVRIELIVPGL